MEPSISGLRPSSAGARRFRAAPRTGVLGLEVPVARGPLLRLIGLAYLGREEAGPGLLLERCSSVHTLGMRFPLDLVFLSATGEPLRIDLGVGPSRLSSCRGAASVLEVPAGSVPSLGGAVTRAGVERRVNNR